MPEVLDFGWGIHVVYPVGKMILTLVGCLGECLDPFIRQGYSFGVASVKVLQVLTLPCGVDEVVVSRISFLVSGLLLLVPSLFLKYLRKKIKIFTVLFENE